MLNFITSNHHKFQELKSILRNLKQVNFQLPEIQEINAQKIIKHKLLASLKYQQGEYIVEDTSLYLACFNYRLPGPLIKWFEKGIGNKAIADLTKKMGNNQAIAKTVIGYAKNKNQIYFFEGIIRGTIVAPQGQLDFGWGPIFKPRGSDKTFGQMTRNEKLKISMRSIAANKLKMFLAKQSRLKAGLA